MGNGVVKSKDSKNPRSGEVTERQMRMAMRRQRKSGKVFCQGCGRELDPDGELSGIEYVKTKRNTEWFFHTRCLNSVWKCKIQWEA